MVLQSTPFPPPITDSLLIYRHFAHVVSVVFWLLIHSKPSAHVNIFVRNNSHLPMKMQHKLGWNIPIWLIWLSKVYIWNSNCHFSKPSKCKQPLIYSFRLKTSLAEIFVIVIWSILPINSILEYFQWTIMSPTSVVCCKFMIRTLINLSICRHKKNFQHFTFCRSLPLLLSN